MAAFQITAVSLQCFSYDGKPIVTWPRSTVAILRGLISTSFPVLTLKLRCGYRAGTGTWNLGLEEPIPEEVRHLTCW